MQLHIWVTFVLFKRVVSPSNIGDFWGFVKGLLHLPMWVTLVLCKGVVLPSYVGEFCAL